LAVDKKPKEMSKSNDQKAVAIATAVKSKAAEKLTEAIGGLVDLSHNVVDYITGPKRIASVNAVRNEAMVAAAHASLEIAKIEAEKKKLRAETAAWVLDRESRRTLNRRSMVAESYKALPAPDAPVSDVPADRELILNVLDEFDTIGDPEVHKIVGRLIAGEVASPGSFPRRTVRVLRDLETVDFKRFTALCRFTWRIGGLTPVIFDPNGPMYTSVGLNFGVLHELDSLGLITFQGLAGFSLNELPSNFHATYGNQAVAIEPPKGQTTLNIGTALYTDAGRRLMPLTHAEIMPGFAEYVAETWRAAGCKVNFVGPVNS
jgi:hypothetical protein